jgi:hypothetical protein
MLDAVNMLCEKPAVPQSDHRAHPGALVVAIQMRNAAVVKSLGVSEKLFSTHRFLPNR